MTCTHTNSADPLPAGWTAKLVNQADRKQNPDLELDAYAYFTTSELPAGWTSRVVSFNNLRPNKILCRADCPAFP